MIFSKTIISALAVLLLADTVNGMLECTYSDEKCKTLVSCEPYFSEDGDDDYYGDFDRNSCSSFFNAFEKAIAANKYDDDRYDYDDDDYNIREYFTQCHDSKYGWSKGFCGADAQKAAGDVVAAAKKAYEDAGCGELGGTKSAGGSNGGSNGGDAPGDFHWCKYSDNSCNNLISCQHMKDVDDDYMPDYLQDYIETQLDAGNVNTNSCESTFKALVEVMGNVLDYDDDDYVDDAYAFNIMKTLHTKCQKLPNGGSERGTCNNRRRDRKDECAALKGDFDAAQTLANQAGNMSPAVSVSPSGVAAAALVAVAALLF